MPPALRDGFSARPPPSTPLMETSRGNPPSDLPGASRIRKSFAALSPYWRMQLPALMLVWSSGLVYCVSFFEGLSLSALVVASWSTLVEGVTMQLLRRYYHRLIARGIGDIALLTRVIIVSIVAGTLTDLLSAGFVAALGIEVPGGMSVPRFVGGVFVMGLFYTAWSILYFAIKRTQAAKAARDMLRDVQAMATRAELAMLRYQLNPHFLFNSLASLRQQIIDDPGKARTMTGELAGYLRYTLNHSEQAEMPLGEEVEAIRKYLALEKIRFEDALEITIEIEPLARDWPVPSFLLQPLVENAFKHGAAPLAGAPLRLVISASVHDGALRLEISNTGQWRERPVATAAAETANSSGVGLANLRRRLQTLYPGRHTFDIGQAAEWVCARISIAPVP